MKENFGFQLYFEEQKFENETKFTTDLLAGHALPRANFSPFVKIFIDTVFARVKATF